MNRSLNVAFVGGGSGGHISPAVAVAEELLTLAPETQFSFCTSNRDVDAVMLANSGLPAESMTHVALPIASSGRRAQYAMQAMKAVRQCRRVFKASRPDVAVSTGGFASIPGVLAAVSLRIPISIIEPNAVPGRANRWLNRYAKITFEGLPLQAHYRKLWKSPLMATGVPVRSQFRCKPGTVKPPEKRNTLLIIGGSQGARSLNQLVLNAQNELDVLPPDWEIVHQTGHSDFSSVSQAYTERQIVADVHPFFTDMADQLSRAGLVISRAGAVAIGETSATGTPSILVPLPSSADDHQTANAAVMEDAGAAKIVEQGQADSAMRLASAIRNITSDPKLHQQMSHSATEAGGQSAASEVAEWIINYCS